MDEETAANAFVPFLKVGFMFTYVAPLVFVLTITMFKEAFDDCKRRTQDKNLNNKEYEILVQKADGTCEFKAVPSKDLKVGTIVKVGKNQRVPADLVILKYSDVGKIFIKTD